MKLTHYAAIAFWVATISIAHAEPDENALGKREGYPIGTIRTIGGDRFKVGGFSSTDKFIPTRVVKRGNDVWPLKPASGDEIKYRFQGETRTLDDYLDRQRVTALLVLKGDQIIAERYRYDRNEHHRFLSFSVSKSVNSVLIGIAADKGLIKSLDDPAESYVPELKGSGYGQATIRQLLRMSSGIKFVEEYNGRDDMSKLSSAFRGESSESPLEVLASFRERRWPAGEKFAYASSETQVLGYVLNRAAGKDISALTSEWLWQPMGAETDAGWNIDVAGAEGVAGRFNATLRDYGRFGLLLANDGRRDERQIVPREYLLDATDATRQPEAFRPLVATPKMGYGYQFWIFPMRTRTFACLGLYGQTIFVQPRSKLVMVQAAVYAAPRASPEAMIEREALWRGVLTTFGGDAEPPQ